MFRSLDEDQVNIYKPSSPQLPSRDKLRTRLRVDDLDRENDEVSDEENN